MKFFSKTLRNDRITLFYRMTRPSWTTVLISECSNHKLAWSKISKFFICPVGSVISNILLVLVHFDRPLENLENAPSFLRYSTPVLILVQNGSWLLENCRSQSRLVLTDRLSFMKPCSCIENWKNADLWIHYLKMVPIDPESQTGF